MKRLEYRFKVTENRRLTSKTYVMRLRGEEGVIENPGQFVNLAVEGKYLRRPISICDVKGDEITLLYDVVGDGTAAMSGWEAGKEVDMLAPLGNGFDMTRSGERPLLLGGGIGIAPMYMLARLLLEQGKSPTVVLGFNTVADVAWADEFRALGVEVLVTTADGSEGIKGFVTDAEVCRDPGVSYFYACGPMPMLRAVCERLPMDGEVSLDERMACGFGVCMCCSLETKSGAKRICKDGPVFTKDELIWK